MFQNFQTIPVNFASANMNYLHSSQPLERTTQYNRWNAHAIDSYQSQPLERTTQYNPWNGHAIDSYQNIKYQKSIV